MKRGTGDGHTVEWVLTGALKPRIQLALERQILHAAVSIPLAQFEQPDLHDRLQRAREALGYRMTNLMLQVAESTQAVVTLLAYGTVLWLASPWLTLVVLLPAAPSAWLKVRAAQSGYIHDYDATPVRRMMAYIRGLVLGASSGQEVRVFRLATHFKERWSKHLARRLVARKPGQGVDRGDVQPRHDRGAGGRLHRRHRHPVYRGFAALAKGRMTFLISHRIGSARLADRILVLEEGRVAEEGTHDALLAAGGLYARFFEAQARWYRRGGGPRCVSPSSPTPAPCACSSRPHPCRPPS